MIVELKPELEALIQRRLASGAFSSAEEVIEHALEFLTAEENWLAENRDMIASRIQEGWDEAQRGELTNDEDVRAEMQWQHHRVFGELKTTGTPRTCGIVATIAPHEMVQAGAVTRTVADTAATRRLIQAASSMARSLKNSVYQRSDQPPHTVTSREALNE